MSVEANMGTVLPQPSIDSLRNEYQLMQLMYHRNLNQHRQARWWRYFSILKRNVQKLLQLFDDLQSMPKKATTIHKGIIEICTYLIRRKIFTKAYYEINTILALGQFIALGFALLAMLARVRSLVLEIDGVDRLQVNVEAPAIVDTHGDFDEIGEEIERENKVKNEEAPTSGVSNERSEDKEIRREAANDRKRTKEPKPGKSKKKKKAKSAIDDIFGF
ncbi:Ribonuclease MRP protein subunit RMP1 [Meyerozyma sp. JA9]|nr:Ribonuclease MRP protein subunit RMP1 [Meyerozyma sp. JA9]